MKLTDKIKYAVFDLDGTLFDSMWLWKKIDYDYLSKRRFHNKLLLFQDQLRI